MGCNTSQEQTPQAKNTSDDGEVNNHCGGENEKILEESESRTNIKSNGEINTKASADIPQPMKSSERSSGGGKENQSSQPEELIFGEDEEEAATKIQAVFRGHQVRANMKQGDNPNTKPDSSAESKSVPEENNDNPSKEELEAEFDPNDAELCSAATRIQATFRGHMQRKIANNELKDDVDLQEITKKVAEELDIDLSDPELNKAATKIQASFRGHKTRKEPSATGAEK